MARHNAVRVGIRAETVLIITADDYGYARGYNRGILRAADKGAIDAVSAMVGRRWCEPAPLLDAGVEIGLHLELPGEEPAAQLERFQQVFGRPPAFLNGHNHCHARAAVAGAVAELAAARGLPVRSVDAEHRRALRAAGVATPDRLIGRMDPSEPVMPSEFAQGAPPPPGVTEWMVHPGYADSESGSSYDRAREEDLDLLLRVSSATRRVRRRTHREALAPT
jgi:chitin disaccharide deacetylase